MHFKVSCENAVYLMFGGLFHTVIIVVIIAIFYGSGRPARALFSQTFMANISTATHVRSVLVVTIHRVYVTITPSQAASSLS